MVYFLTIYILHLHLYVCVGYGIAHFSDRIYKHIPYTYGVLNSSSTHYHEIAKNSVWKSHYCQMSFFQQNVMKILSNKITFNEINKEFRMNFISLCWMYFYILKSKWNQNIIYQAKKALIKCESLFILSQHG